MLTMFLVESVALTVKEIFLLVLVTLTAPGLRANDVATGFPGVWVG